MCCLFLLLWKWESWQEKLSHCGQTWPPIKLPCGGILWQQRGRKTAGTFCPACIVAKINKSSNSAQLLTRLDVSNNDRFTMATELSVSHTQIDTWLAVCMHMQERKVMRKTTCNKSLCTLETTQQKWMYLLARPCREVLMKMLPWAKINWGSSCLLSCKCF